jgi:methylmalonyl-CoA/ethylmalonyl-CoA epimerase
MCPGRKEQLGCTPVDKLGYSNIIPPTLQSTDSRMKVNHIALAVPSIHEFLTSNQFLYGDFSRGPLIVNETQDVREMFITDGSTVFELLEPMSDKSPVMGFLKRNRSGGLIHVAFDVEDLSAAIADVERAGGKLIVEPVPDIAFDYRRIAFVILNGQLSEFIEMPAPAR